MTCQEIIARLEMASEPDSVLDGEIWMTLHPHWRGYPRTKVGGWFSPAGMTCPASPYTSFIDAAMTLVPEECAWRCGCQIDFTPDACVWGHDIHFDEVASTPAIALCIAALKAREAINAQGKG